MKNCDELLTLICFESVNFLLYSNISLRESNHFVDGSHYLNVLFVVVTVRS